MSQIERLKESHEEDLALAENERQQAASLGQQGRTDGRERTVGVKVCFRSASVKGFARVV